MSRMIDTSPTPATGTTSETEGRESDTITLRLLFCRELAGVQPCPQTPRDRPTARPTRSDGHSPSHCMSSRWGSRSDRRRPPRAGSRGRRSRPQRDRGPLPAQGRGGPLAAARQRRRIEAVTESPAEDRPGGPGDRPVGRKTDGRLLLAGHPGRLDPRHRAARRRGRVLRGGGRGDALSWPRRAAGGRSSGRCRCWPRPSRRCGGRSGGSRPPTTRTSLRPTSGCGGPPPGTASSSSGSCGPTTRPTRRAGPASWPASRPRPGPTGTTRQRHASIELGSRYLEAIREGQGTDDGLAGGHQGRGRDWSARACRPAAGRSGSCCCRSSTTCPSGTTCRPASGSCCGRSTATWRPARHRRTLRRSPRSRPPRSGRPPGCSSGRSVVLIGGIRRPEAQEALRTALGLKELVWIETREHQSIEAFEPAVARPEVAAGPAGDPLVEPRLRRREAVLRPPRQAAGPPAGRLQPEPGRRPDPRPVQRSDSGQDNDKGDSGGPAKNERSTDHQHLP